MMGFLFLFRFRAFDGTVKTFKRQFYPFQGDAPSLEVFRSVTSECLEKFIKQSEAYL